MGVCCVFFETASFYILPSFFLFSLFFRFQKSHAFTFIDNQDTCEHLEHHAIKHPYVDRRVIVPTSLPASFIGVLR